MIKPPYPINPPNHSCQILSPVVENVNVVLYPSHTHTPFPRVELDLPRGWVCHGNKGKRRTGRSRRVVAVESKQKIMIRYAVQVRSNPKQKGKSGIYVVLAREGTKNRKIAPEDGEILVDVFRASQKGIVCHLISSQRNAALSLGRPAIKAWLSWFV